jgi:chromate transporter
MQSSGPRRLLQVAALFLKLGLTSFGGPAAHIAMFREEIVVRRKWLSDGEFLDLLGATNLIPGPNSTEMAIHIGFNRAGWPGLIIAGVCFISPAVLIVLALAWLYGRFGTTPQVAWLMYGIKPVVIAIIGQAIWTLGNKALKSPLLAAVGLGVLALYRFGFNEIGLLFAGGLVVMLAGNFDRLRKLNISALTFPFGGGWPGPIAQVPIPFGLPLLFLTFLKIGAVLYGSGYVLLAFVHADFVQHLGWLTDRQLVDAVAVGQFTPGPLFTTATFIGYLLGGMPGALLATLGIFLPSFVFVALSNPLIPRLRNSAWLSGLLDGVNASSLGLMAGVTIQLTSSSLTDLFTILLAVLASILLIKYRAGSTWLIAGGALAGFLIFLVR